MKPAVAFFTTELVEHHQSGASGSLPRGVFATLPGIAHHAVSGMYAPAKSCFGRALLQNAPHAILTQTTPVLVPLRTSGRRTQGVFLPSHTILFAYTVLDIEAAVPHSGSHGIIYKILKRLGVGFGSLSQAKTYMYDS